MLPYRDEIRTSHIPVRLLSCYSRDLGPQGARRGYSFARLILLGIASVMLAYAQAVGALHHDNACFVAVYLHLGYHPHEPAAWIHRCQFGFRRPVSFFIPLSGLGGYLNREFGFDPGSMAEAFCIYSAHINGALSPPDSHPFLQEHSIRRSQHPQDRISVLTISSGRVLTTGTVTSFGMDSG